MHNKVWGFYGNLAKNELSANQLAKSVNHSLKAAV